MTVPIAPAPLDLDLLADALADPTRRAILKHLATSYESWTAAEIGALFSIHRTVARAHLEKLAETGLVASELKYRPAGGRPSKVYCRSEQRLDIQLPIRRYELLTDLLVSILERFGPAAEVLAEQVGIAFGKRLSSSSASTIVPAAGTEELPGRQTFADADLATLIEPLTKMGAVMSFEVDGGILIIRTQNCLFHEVAVRRPGLVCTLDRAVIQGLLSGSGREYVPHEDQVGCEAINGTCVLMFRAAREPWEVPATARNQGLSETLSRPATTP